MTRVLVIAGSAVERDSLEELVARMGSGELVVVGDGEPRSARASSAALARALEAHEPDVVLLALSGSEEETNDLSIEPFVQSASAVGAALVVLADASEGWIADALRAGTRAVLARDAAARSIVAAIDAAAAGLTVFDATLAATVIPPSTSGAPVRGSGDAESAELTPREREVLHMLAEGLGNKQIAGRLAISEHTVKFHVASIFAKLHASTRTEAVMLGARRGLVVV